MFTLIRVYAAAGFFNRAGDCRSLEMYNGATAADALRVAREYIASGRYHAVGIKVGNRHNSKVMWLK